MLDPSTISLMDCELTMAPKYAPLSLSLSLSMMIPCLPFSPALPRRRKKQAWWVRSVHLTYNEPGEEGRCACATRPHERCNPRFLVLVCFVSFLQAVSHKDTTLLRIPYRRRAKTQLPSCVCLLGYSRESQRERERKKKLKRRWRQSRQFRLLPVLHR